MVDSCRSGGSKGADQLFGELAAKAGHEVIHYSFQNHFSPCDPSTIKILSYPLLCKADIYLRQANDRLNRKFPTRSEYVNNLLRRNYYQINSSHFVYASTALDDNLMPLGGTAWAIMMAILRRNSHIVNFDHSRDKWYMWNYASDSFFEMSDKPRRPQGIYAGIGSSELPENGRNAIIALYN